MKKLKAWKQRLKNRQLKSNTSIPVENSDMQDPVEAAKDNLLNKAGKLELAQQAVLTQHLAEIAKDDVEDVRKLKANKLGGAFAMPNQSKGNTDGVEDGVGNIIVCDDYIHNNPSQPPQPSKILPMIYGMLMGVCLLSLPVIAYKILESSKPTENKNITPANTTTTIKKGFIIDLPDGTK